MIKQVAISGITKPRVESLKLFFPTTHFEGLGGNEYILTFYDEEAVTLFEEWQNKQNSTES